MVKKEGFSTKKVVLPKNIFLPPSIFQDRSLSVLESITEYLKDSKNFSYHEIAEIMNRDDRTIWTCYNRAKKKRSKVS